MSGARSPPTKPRCHGAYGSANQMSMFNRRVGRWTLARVGQASRATSSGVLQSAVSSSGIALPSSLHLLSSALWLLISSCHGLLLNSCSSHSVIVGCLGKPPLSERNLIRTGNAAQAKRCPVHRQEQCWQQPGWLASEAHTDPPFWGFQSGCPIVGSRQLSTRPFTPETCTRTLLCEMRSVDSHQPFQQR